MSLTSLDAEIQDDGKPMDIGQEKDHLSYQQYGSPELLLGLYLRRGEGAGGHFGREPRQSHISFKSTAS